MREHLEPTPFESFRFVLSDDAPDSLEDLSEGMPEEETAPCTRLRRANAGCLLRVRNAGIQLEVALREIREETERLRELYRSIAKPRPSRP